MGEIHRDEVEEAEINFQGRVMKEIIDHGKETAASWMGSWMIMGEVCDSEQSDDAESSSDEDDSEGSDVSSASSDMAVEEDVSSSPSASSSSSSNGPLYELSELLAQLPPGQRSGLSKHYQGKSQSFTSLANVKSVEDLAKRAKPYRKSMKRQCKYYTTPKAMISKKQKKKTASSSRVSFLSSVTNARGSFFMSNSSNSGCKSSITVHKQKHFG